MLRTKDSTGLIEFIEQRHRERFFEPIQQLRTSKANAQGYGFAMMALCSLLVETIQSYRDGLPTTNPGELGRLRNLRGVPTAYQLPAKLRVNGAAAFRRFFQHFRRDFDGIGGIRFDKNVRNGLLHQAQTKRGWKIGTGKPSLYAGKTIDRNIFASRLDQAFSSYLAELRSRKWDTAVWRNARRKTWWLIRLS